MRVWFGVDVGGTFTDLVQVSEDGRTGFVKVPSTPADSSIGVLTAIAEAGITGTTAELVRFAHGTTVATNALLERHGARTALVTTEGFADVLEIGRQNRPDLYDLTRDRPPSLVPAELRFTLSERTGPDGPLRPVDPDQIDRLADTLANIEGLAAVAVCFLFSFRYPDHEHQVAAVLRERLPGCVVVTSSEVLPQFREYERFTTTVADAYLGPGMSRYLRGLAAAAADRGIPEPSVMQSSGGVLPADAAARNPASLVLSGPAAGVVGAAHIGRRSGFTDLLTFDMGGTSTDVAAVLDATPQLTTSSVIAGVPIMLPSVDVHSVSAGGGSLAWVDSGGALRVGPTSAGADPGPACYGVGTAPTVTDADLVLGHLADRAVLGGRVRLSRQAAWTALGTVGKRIGLTPLQVAEGVVAVADAQMARALRVVSVERGIDPRELTLVAFGGAGGMHACSLAEDLGMERILVPEAAGVLSALGLAVGATRRDHLRTVLRRLRDVELAPLFDELTRQAEDDLPGAVLQRFADCRYTGQSHELTVPADRPDGPAEAFAAEHLRRYGYTLDPEDVEITAIRVVATVPGPSAPPSPSRQDGPSVGEAASDSGPRPGTSRREVFLSGRWHPVEVIPRARLRPGDLVDGPAVVEFPEATCVLRPGWTGRVDEAGSLLLRRTGKEG
jgi:N-methylhydantoinase A